MVSSEDNIIPIRVLNPSDKPIKLNKRTLMGRLAPVKLGDRVMRVSVETVSQENMVERPAKGDNLVVDSEQSPSSGPGIDCSVTYSLMV